MLMSRLMQRWLTPSAAVAICAFGLTCARGQELPWVDGSVTIAVLPDTQYYSQTYPSHFEGQTRWIADNAETRSIAHVFHLGDITQHDTAPQWEVARRCFAMLGDKVPYLLVPGNHDYREQRQTRLSEYFPVASMTPWPTFGGARHTGKLDNSYHLFSIHRRKWIALGLECGPRDEVVDWANGVLEQYPDRLGIVVTHAYMFRDNTRYDHTAGPQRASPHGYAMDGNDGEELWQKLIRRHKNLRIVISGHVATGGLGYLVSRGDHGNAVHQMMACYQKRPQGGEGYMRVLEFLPDGHTVQVRTFSPTLKRVRQSALEDFSFKLEGIGG